MTCKKYTLEYEKNELKSLLENLRKDKEIIYLWELFVDKPYSRQRYWEWVSIPNSNTEDLASRYWDNEEVANLSVTIKEILETRAVKWAITNKLNPTFTIFHLKNNYKDNWKDKSEVDNKNTNIDITTTLTDNQKQLIAKRILNGWNNASTWWTE